MSGPCVNGIIRLLYARGAEPALWKEQQGKAQIPVQNFWDAKTSRDADSPETHDGRFDADAFSLPGK